jgi:glycosyltransferase involved in cell wall biosynthesis
MKNVSLICTVYNEEKNLDFFLKSIINQTKLPKEFIIVDGGSKDKTYGLLKELSKKYKWIKVFQEMRANISRGRNFAVEKAKNEVILVCDAGGEYKRDWIEKMIEGFNGEVSFGMDEPRITNNFQRILAKKILHKNVPGSSRNMIFLKKIWAEVGGYPEDLERAEDTLFDARIRKKGYRLSRIPEAICYWEMRKDLKEVKHQFYGYGYWDGISQRRHKILPLKYRFLVFTLLITFPVYPILKLLSLFSLGIKIDFERRYAYFFGFLRGYIKNE